MVPFLFPVLQIQRGNRDNLEIISHISSIKTYILRLSLESSPYDSSNEESQHTVSLRDKKKYPRIIAVTRATDEGVMKIIQR